MLQEVLEKFSVYVDADLRQWYSVQEILQKYNLNITNVTRLLRTHVDHTQCKRIALKVGRPGWFITRLGLFQLLLKLRVSDSIKFADWVVYTMISDLLHNGFYIEKQQSESEQSYAQRNETLCANNQCLLKATEFV